MSDNTKRFGLIKRPNSACSHEFWPSILTPTRICQDRISPCWLSYHLTTEVLSVHIPANFQHIDRASEGIGYYHADEYSQWGSRLRLFSAVGTFKRNKEHWLSCWALLILHMESSDFLFPPSLKEFNSHFADAGFWCTRKVTELGNNILPKRDTISEKQQGELSSVDICIRNSKWFPFPLLEIFGWWWSFSSHAAAGICIFITESLDSVWVYIPPNPTKNT